MRDDVTVSGGWTMLFHPPAGRVPSRGQRLFPPSAVKSQKLCNSCDSPMTLGIPLIQQLLPECAVCREVDPTIPVKTER